MINLCFSQDSVFVEGLYIQRFLKKEISFIIQNDILRQEGKPSQWMIDYRTQSYYFTLKIDSTITLMNEKELESIIYPHTNYKNLEVFMFPPFNDYVNNLVKDKVVTCETKFSNDCSYFTLENDTVHVYKIYKIRGNALRIIVDNNYLDSRRNIKMEFNWNIDSSNLNRKIPFFYAYLFYRYESIDCHYQPQGFKYWNLLE